MKSLFILTFIFFVNLTWAHENCGTSDQFTAFEKLLSHFGANEKNVGHAPCKVLKVPDTIERDSFIVSKLIGKPINAKINGVQFKDENPVLVEAFNQFTTLMNFSGFEKRPQNEQKDFQAEFKINPSCTKVRCAMEKIWGKDYAEKLLFLKLKHSYNASEFSFQQTVKFKSEELDDILIGLEDLPPHFIPLGRKDQRLSHVAHGKNLGSTTVLANASMMIFDAWDEKNSIIHQYTIFHEASHNMAGILKRMDESPGWLNLSAWVKKGDKWDVSANACKVSEYAMTNPWEDFAETMTAYRYNGADLKVRCPEKYAFAKNKVFKGIEYLEESQCTAVSHEKLVKAEASAIQSILDDQSTTNFTKDQILAKCSGSFSTYPLLDTEMAECLLQLKSPSVSEIPNTAINQSLLLERLFEQIKQDPKFLDAIIRKSPQFAETVNGMIEDSFVASLPTNFGKDVTANHSKWYLSEKICGGFAKRISGDTEAILRCKTNQFVEDDKKWQSWGIGQFPIFKASSIFSDEAAESNVAEAYRERMISALIKMPIPIEVEKKEQNEFKEALARYLKTKTNKKIQDKGWQNISPEEFCDKYYTTAGYELNAYGVEFGQPIPVLRDRCITLQSAKKKRFVLTSYDWKKFLP